MLNYCLLPRTIVEVTGDDRVNFLQSLITQDLTLLQHNSSIFSLLLNIKGRYLLDFFIINTGEALLIDIATSDVDLLITTLKRYKLRAKVSISIVSNLKVFGIFSTEHNHTSNNTKLSNQNFSNYTNTLIILSDNRTTALGLRVITNQDHFLDNPETVNFINSYFDASHLDQILPVPLADYTVLRYHLGVPENTELIKEKSIPLECNFDEYNAISFNKGCYLGQEFTNASKRTLTIRKRIISLSFNTDYMHKINNDTQSAIVNANQETVGKILAISNNYIMALIKIEDIKNNQHLWVNGLEVHPIIPKALQDILS